MLPNIAFFIFPPCSPPTSLPSPQNLLINNYFVLLRPDFIKNNYSNEKNALNQCISNSYGSLH